MYAIVEIAGNQYRVEKNMKLKAPLLHKESGAKVEFDRVLFYADDSGKNQIGQPVVKNMKVAATVLEHGRDKKVVVFKKKRRKGFRVKNGHRQGYSLIQIDNISAETAVKTEKTKAETKPKVEPKAKAETKTVSKTAPVKTKEVKKAKPKAKVETKAKAKEAPKKTTAPKKTAAKAPAGKAKTETKKKAEPKAKAKPKSDNVKEA